MKKIVPLLVVCGIGLVCCIGLLVWIPLKGWLVRRKKKREQFDFDEKTLTIRLDGDDFEK